MFSRNSGGCVLPQPANATKSAKAGAVRNAKSTILFMAMTGVGYTRQFETIASGD
jgi:hypothetical protein